MSDAPIVDGRDGEEVLEEARGIAPHYTDEWDSDSGDVGSVLLTLFSSMAEDVIERLNQVPEKHRIAFFDALGFGRKPPQPARLPVTFEVTDDVDENVAITEGTQAVAPAQGERPEQLFEIPDGGGFEGTPANVESVYTVDPDADDVFEHWDALEAGTRSELFTGTDRQGHSLNIGHADVLNLKSGSRIWVTLETNSPDAFEDRLKWDFFGEVESDDGKETDWHRIGKEWISTNRKDGNLVTIGLEIPSREPAETEGREIAAETKDKEIAGIETRWIRCRIPNDEELEEEEAEYSPRDLFGVEVRSVELSLVAPDDDGTSGNGNGQQDGSGDGQPGGAVDGWIYPDDLLSGDVPLEVPTETDDDVDLYPFGETWPLRNTFYVDSEEVFTKEGVPVTLEFTQIGMEDADLITFEDQLSNGLTVTVHGVVVPEVDALSGGALVAVTVVEPGGTKVLGRSDRLEPGETHENVRITLNRRLTGETRLTANLYPLPAPGTELGAPYDPGQSKTAKIVLFDGGDPRLSWEYWNGEGWARLEDLTDMTDELRESGTVSFTVPDDLEATTTAGHEGHWIRARLVNGEYLRLAYDEDDLEEGKVSTSVLGVAPHFGGVEIYYGKPDPDTDEWDNSDTTNGVTPSTTKEPDHLVTLNNLDYSTDVAGSLGSGLRPFHGLPDEKGTLYVGFDGELRGGPINLLFSLADEEYPEGFYPRVRWESRTATEGDEWVTIDTEDGTESLTERGIVGLVFRDPTVATERFGEELHWIRARIDGEEFVSATAVEEADDPTAVPIVITGIDAGSGRVVLANAGVEGIDLGGYRILFECARPEDRHRTFPNGTTLDPSEALTVETREEPDGTGTESDDSTVIRFDFEQPPLDDCVRNAVTILTPDGKVVARAVEGEVEPCERWLETVPPAGEPDRTPPVVLGLHPNTGWAYNVATIEGELLGSSDGTPNQEFTASSPPVMEETIWVNELSVLSEGERRDLREADPTRVDEVMGAREEPIAFWIQWIPVEDFLDSSADDRHYCLDPATGRLTFGDGNRGRIPPRGTDNVRIDYRTGGGATGNVETGAVTELVSSIPFVDSVANPEPGDAGADAESVDQVVARAPKELRDRGKAVSREDFERIAMAASRKLARVRCIPSMNRAGEYSPGWVTLLIVPNDRRPKPVPSVELKHHVSEEVSKYAPATLVSHGEVRRGEDTTPAPELVVRGPSYVEVSVVTTVHAGDVGSISVMETRVTRELDAFLHPLTGGETGDGWGFGELPCLSDLYALLEGIDGVDHVVDLSMTFRGGDEEVTVTEGQESPNVAADVLVFGGRYTIEIDGTNEVTTTGRQRWD